MDFESKTVSEVKNWLQERGFGENIRRIFEGQLTLAT